MITLPEDTENTNAQRIQRIQDAWNALIERKREVSYFNTSRGHLTKEGRAYIQKLEGMRDDAIEAIGE